MGLVLSSGLGAEAARAGRPTTSFGKKAFKPKWQAFADDYRAAYFGPFDRVKQPKAFFLYGGAFHATSKHMYFVETRALTPRQEASAYRALLDEAGAKPSMQAGVEFGAKVAAAVFANLEPVPPRRLGANEVPWLTGSNLATATRQLLEARPALAHVLAERGISPSELRIVARRDGMFVELQRGTNKDERWRMPSGW